LAIERPGEETAHKKGKGKVALLFLSFQEATVGLFICVEADTTMVREDSTVGRDRIRIGRQGAKGIMLATNLHGIGKERECRLNAN
jgi:hypothetical protein